MPRQRHICLFLLFFSSFSAASIGRADVVIGAGSSSGVMLYAIEGERVYRFECAPGTQDFNHDTCRAKQRTTSASDLFPRLAASFGDYLAQYERELRDHWVTLARIDVKIWELLNTSVPTGTDPMTAAQVDGARVELARAEGAASAIADQIARIETELAHGDDAALATQLDSYRAKYAAAARVVETRRAAFLDARQAYIDARHAESSVLNQLIKMSETRLRDVERCEKRIADALREIEGGLKLADQLRDTGFAFEYQTYTWPATHLTEIFQASETAYRTVSFHADEHVHDIAINIPSDGTLETIACDIDDLVADKCDYSFVAPDGTTLSTMQWPSNQSVSFDIGRLQRDFVVSSHILEAPLRGTWHVKWSCTGEALASPDWHLTPSTDCIARRAP